MARLPLSTLPVFRLVAELQNLRAAAEAAHLTHSAVSQQLRTLEERLGFLVFDRRGRRVVLNPAGQALLRAVQGALAQLDDGVQQAAAIARGTDAALRVTMLPSFAQRWLLPRMARWRQRHPDLVLEIDASIRVADLQREGLHAAIRQGRGPWAGLASEPLFGTPVALLVLGSPAAAERLREAPLSAIAREPLLGDRGPWERWLAEGGLRASVTPVATFNDAGLMLQAAEQGLGLAIARVVLAADALRDGRLVRLSPRAVADPEAQPYHLVYPPALAEWPPLQALRNFLQVELRRSLRGL